MTRSGPARWILLGLAALAAAACGSGGDDGGEVIALDEVEGCSPLVPRACLLPFPNGTMARPDPASPTGRRLHVLPSNLDVPPEAAEPLAAFLNRLDGFSLGVPIVTHFPGPGVDAARLPRLEDLAASLDPGSPVQMFDMDSGERLPLWAEVDRRAADPEDQALMIRYQIGLKPAHRHLVAITDALTDVRGDPVAVSEAFRALRDGVATDSPQVESLREEYEGIFAFLEGEGVPRGRLASAWSFVSASDAEAMNPVRAMLEAALEAQPSPVDYAVASCWSDEADDRQALGCLEKEDLHRTTWRRAVGTFRTPNFLNAEGRIEFDGDGRPIVQGLMDAPFVFNLPDSVRDAAPGTVPAVMFGHGFLSNPESYLANDTDANGQMALSDKLGALFIGSRWLGFTSDDFPLLVSVAEDFTALLRLHDRLAQGIVNQSLTLRFLERALRDDPLLAAREGGGSLIDPDRRLYTGISLGGIAGTVLLAIHPDVKTGVLHVPSSMWLSFAQHSDLFTPLQSLFDLIYDSRLEQQLAFGLVQHLVDPIDPINYARHVIADPITPLGPKNGLWQINWGDSSAPDFNGFALGRTLGVGLVEPTPHAVFGLEGLATPTGPGASAVMIYDPQLGRRPTENDRGAFTTHAHQATRRNDEVHRQILDYFAEGAEGTITTHCGGGPCVVVPIPEEGKETYP